MAPNAPHRFRVAPVAVLFLGLFGSPARSEAPAEEGPTKPGPWADRPAFLDLETPRRAGDTAPLFEEPDVVKGSFEKKYEGFLGLLSSRLKVDDTRNVPEYLGQTNTFQTEEALQMKVKGPLAVFGQVGANSSSMDGQALKLKGKTGLVWKWDGLPLGEVQVRGGQAVSCDDPHRPERMKEQSEVFLELQYNCPLPGKLRLEYEGTANPALNLTERDRLKQDLHLAVPVGANGKLNLGARHSWESTPAARPWTDGMEVYIGLDLKR
jgi:hypothetical protein